MSAAPTLAAESVIPFSADPSAPIEIEADRLELDRASARAVFVGTVTARQGPLILHAGQMIVLYDPSTPQERITRLEAEGDVRLNSAQGQQAQGTKAAYEIASREMILVGPVTLRSGGHVLTGARLVVDLRSGQSRLESGPRRVRGLFRARPELESPE